MQARHSSAWNVARPNVLEVARHGTTVTFKKREVAARNEGHTIDYICEPLANLSGRARMLRVCAS